MNNDRGLAAVLCGSHAANEVQKDSSCLKLIKRDLKFGRN